MLISNNLQFAFSIKNERHFAWDFRFRKRFFDKITGFLGWGYPHPRFAVTAWFSRARAVSLMQRRLPPRKSDGDGAPSLPWGNERAAARVGAAAPRQRKGHHVVGVRRLMRAVTWMQRGLSPREARGMVVLIVRALQKDLITASSSVPDSYLRPPWDSPS